MPDNMIVIFEFHSSNDLVVFNGVVMPIGTVYLEKAKNEAKVKIAYHDVGTQDPHDPSQFPITMTHKVGFAFNYDAEDKAGDDNKATMMAAKCEPSMWNTKVTRVLWQVRWTPKGLTPIKPSVYNLADITLLPGRCLKLDAA